MFEIATVSDTLIPGLALLTIGAVWILLRRHMTLTPTGSAEDRASQARVAARVRRIAGTETRSSPHYVPLPESRLPERIRRVIGEDGG